MASEKRRAKRNHKDGCYTGDFRTPEITGEAVINSSEAWFNGGLKGQWGFDGLNRRNKDLLNSVEEVPKNKDVTRQGCKESASSFKAYLIHYCVRNLSPILFHLKVS